MPLEPAPIQDIALNNIGRFTQRWIAWFGKLVNRVNESTGWAYYQDSLYTSGSPLSISSGVRTQILINGSGSATRTAFLPGGTTALWDGTKITPIKYGDNYICRLDFEVNPASNNQHLDVELQVDTGNIIFSYSLPLTKGAGSDMQFALTIPAYVGNTFLANGGKIFFTPSGNCTFYNFGIFISRVGTP